MNKSVFVLLLIALCSSFTLNVNADDTNLLDKVSIGGDLRYRLETINQEYEVSRHRHSIYAHLNFVGGVSSSLDVIIGIGSESYSDRVNSNQTVGDTFSGKTLWLDLAYFDYHPFNGGNFYAGRMNNLFEMVGDSELVWDSDFNPEGLAISLEPEFNNATPFVRGALFWIEERKDDEDSFVIGTEFGLKLKSDNFYILAGGRYIVFVQTEEHQVFWGFQDSFGNSTFEDIDGDLYYLYDYSLLGEFVEIGGDDWSLFADYVANEELNKNNRAWLVGASLGKCRVALDLCARYSYRRTEQDSVIGVFSDAEFSDGMTGSKGHEVNLGSNISDNVSTQITYFNSKFIYTSINYQRVQIDLSAKF